MRIISSVMYPAFLAVALSAAGCDLVGPTAVRQSRPDYNAAIHDTSKEQVFLNVVRVKYYDTPFFMDVSEVDASLQLQGQMTTGLSFPQAFIKGSSGSYSAGHDYTLGGAVQYQESPTIRFQPLTGAALIAQVSSCITVDSIAALYDSGWPIGPVLDLAADRMATRARDNFPALNALMALDSYRAIVLAAVKSTVSISPGGGSGGGPNDTLVIYFEPERLIPHDRQQGAKAALQAAAKLWARLLRIYDGTQSYDVPLKDALPKLEGGAFDPRQDHYPRRIELRAAPVDPARLSHDVPSSNDVIDFAPIMRTHSAMGVLRSVTQEDPRLDFITPEDLKPAPPWSQVSVADQPFDLYFYTESIQPSQPSQPSSKPAGRKEIHIATRASGEESPLSQGLDLSLDPDDPNNQQERKLAHSRRYILIVVDDKPAPATAFVSTRKDVVMNEPGKPSVRKTKYFYIDGNDYISQRNFGLLATFLTIQASPFQAPLLTPTLSVGGH